MDWSRFLVVSLQMINMYGFFFIIASTVSQAAIEDVTVDLTCNNDFNLIESDCANIKSPISKFLVEVLYTQYNHSIAIADQYSLEKYIVLNSISTTKGGNSMNVLVAYSEKHQDILVTINAVELNENWSYKALNSLYREGSDYISYHNDLHQIIARKEKFADTITILTTGQNSVVGQIIANDTKSTLDSYGYRHPPSVRLISFDGFHLCNNEANQAILLKGIVVFTCKSNKTISLSAKLLEIDLNESRNKFFSDAVRPKKRISIPHIYDIPEFIIRNAKNVFQMFNPAKKYWAPTTKEEVPLMKKHIAYGEMIAFVYDTVERDEDSLNYQENFLGCRKFMEPIVESLFKGYKYNKTLRGYPAGSRNSFFGFAAFNYQEMELVFVFRGSVFSNDWAANLDAAASLWDQKLTDDRGPQRIKNFGPSR